MVTELPPYQRIPEERSLERLICLYHWDDVDVIGPDVVGILRYQRRKFELGAKTMNKNATQGNTPSELIDSRIMELGDWRGTTLARARELIKQAAPDVVEEWKWNVPVWSHHGIICTGETYKTAFKLTFAKGASLSDPTGLFTSSLEGKVRRAIDFREGGALDEDAFKALIRDAVALNSAK